MLDEAFDLFAKAAPATVMIRGVLENILSANRLNAVFEDVATVQYPGTCLRLGRSADEPGGDADSPFRSCGLPGTGR